MKYANLFGLVILTIILIFVVQTISIRSRIALDNVEDDDDIKEGLTFDPRPDTTDAIPDCLVPVNTQQIVKSTLGQNAYTTCWEIEQLLHTFNRLRITNMSDVLTQANDNLNITTCSELNQVFIRMVRVCPKTAFNVIFIILYDFGMRSGEDVLKFITLVERRRLNVITNDYYVFPCGREQDNNCLTNIILRMGANFEDFEQIINISSRFRLFSRPIDFYKFLFIARSIEFIYTEDDYIKLLRYLQNHVAIAPDCDNGTYMFRKMCSLQKLLKSINSGWPIYISCVEQIQSIAGPQPELATSIRSFMNYWNEGCTSDGVQGSDAQKLYKELTYDSNNIAQMLYLMYFINDRTNNAYFNYPGRGTTTNLNTFWQTMNNEKFTIYQIIQHANQGSTAPHYINKRKSVLLMERFETAAPTFSESFSDFLRNPIQYLFGREGYRVIQTEEEMIQNSRRLTISDDQALRKFGITKMTQLLALEASMGQYTKNAKLSTTNTDWDNMIVLVNTLQAAGVDNTNWKQYLELMIAFGATTAHMWIEVLSHMAKLNIKTYVVASEFLKILVQFKVSYTNNFSSFMEEINNFGFAKLRNNFTNFKYFINDMMRIGYNYQSHPDQVNTILAYLTKFGFDFTQYRFNSLAQLIIMSLFKYSSTTDYGKNAIRDILNFKQLDLANVEWEAHGSKYKDQTWLYQAIGNQITILARGNKSNFISANKQSIIPFFYEDEEFNKIVSKVQFSDSDIINTMKSIAGGIKNYIKSLDRKQSGVNKLIEQMEVVKLMIEMYPYAVFQFLSTEIRSNPVDEKSVNRVAVNKFGANKKSQFRFQALKMTSSSAPM